MAATQNTRYTALDVLRGMTVCFMIIVNSPGSGANPYALLEHAAWHGFTPTDLVFPTFLFVVGNAMAFSMEKFRYMDNGQVVLSILKRTAIIFLLGYLMYWFPFFRPDENGVWSLSPISKTRIPGVLQRIALCYGIAALMIHFLAKRAVWGLTLLFLLGYWALLAGGGDYTLQGNLVLRIDRWLLGEGHLYHGEGVAFDPEGLLSTFPSVANVVIGYEAGRLIREKGNGYETIAKLAVSAAVLIGVAYLWNQLFPINKKLWTGSFAVYTSGLSMMLLAVLVYVIEVMQRKSWARPFEVFGKNPLFIYLMSELMVILLWTIPSGKGSTLYEKVNENAFQRIAPGAFGSLLFALTVMLTCWMAAWWLDRRKVYIRV
jgi:predicted acyltransferase